MAASMRDLALPRPCRISWHTQFPGVCGWRASAVRRLVGSAQMTRQVDRPAGGSHHRIAGAGAGLSSCNRGGVVQTAARHSGASLLQVHARVNTAPAATMVPSTAMAQSTAASNLAQMAHRQAFTHAHRPGHSPRGSAPIVRPRRFTLPGKRQLGHFIRTGAARDPCRPAQASPRPSGASVIHRRAVPGARNSQRSDRRHPSPAPACESRTTPPIRRGPTRWAAFAPPPPLDRGGREISLASRFGWHLSVCRGSTPVARIHGGHSSPAGTRWERGKAGATNSRTLSLGRGRLSHGAQCSSPGTTGVLGPVTMCVRRC